MHSILHRNASEVFRQSSTTSIACPGPPLVVDESDHGPSHAFRESIFDLQYIRSSNENLLRNGPWHYQSLPELTFLDVTRYLRGESRAPKGPEWFEIQRTYEQAEPYDSLSGGNAASYSSKYDPFIQLICNDLNHSVHHNATAFVQSMQFQECFRSHRNGTFEPQPPHLLKFIPGEFINFSIPAAGYLSQQDYGVLTLNENARVQRNTCQCPKSSQDLRLVEATSTHTHLKDLQSANESSSRDYPCSVMEHSKNDPTQNTSEWEIRACCKQTRLWTLVYLTETETESPSQNQARMRQPVKDRTFALKFYSDLAFLLAITVPLTLVHFAALLPVILNVLLMLRSMRSRPSRTIRQGYNRLYWRCTCGKPQFGDYLAGDAKGFIRFEKSLQLQQENVPLVRRERKPSPEKIIAGMVCELVYEIVHGVSLSTSNFKESLNDMASQYRSGRQRDQGEKDHKQPTFSSSKSWSRKNWRSIYQDVATQSSMTVPTTTLGILSNSTDMVLRGVSLSTSNGAKGYNVEPMEYSTRDGADRKKGNRKQTVFGSPTSNSSGTPRSIHRAVDNPIIPPDRCLRQYFELCVDTSSLKISLGEINLNSLTDGSRAIRTDAQLFKLIHDRYFDIRKNRRWTFLYKPVNIEFVRFSLYDGGRVGIYEQPLSLPPESEVKEGRYHYYECPMDPLPPIDHRTFFHYFWNHEGHKHSISRVFPDRLPKKINVSMHEQGQSQALNLGWGVHIIEGPNKSIISFALFLILCLSFAVSLGYSVATKAQESGFGIGQWIVATLTVGLSALYFHISE